MARGARREPGFEIRVGDDPETVLYAERLRDGRVALGTRRRQGEGWEAGELHLLAPGDYLDLSAWLAPLVSDAWIDAVRDRSEQPLRTADELYGGGVQGASRLAHEMLAQLPPAFISRALILLANSIGPDARKRLVDELNRTSDLSADAMLRRRMADESEAFAYAVAAAALFDAIATGTADAED